MPIHWTLKLVCEDCGTRVVFEDEKPEWKRDEKLAAAVRAAEEFVAEHKGKRRSEMPTPPPLVGSNILTGNIHVLDYPSLDYAECPACGGICRKWSEETEANE